MKNAPSFLALALTAAFVTGAFAQTAASKHPTRAEVKAQASTDKVPTGELAASSVMASQAESTKVRADVKAETKQAAKAGETIKAGQIVAPAKMAASDAKSTKSRATVKAEASASVKAGALPAGEIASAAKK